MRRSGEATRPRGKRLSLRDAPGALAPGRNAARPTKAPARRMAWRVIHCRPHGRAGAAALCVSCNNAGERRARRADGLVRTSRLRRRRALPRPLPSNRTPPAGARGAAERPAAGESESRAVHRPGGDRRDKGQRAGVAAAWDRGHRPRETLGAGPFSEEPGRCRASAHRINTALPPSSSAQRSAQVLT